ncbi:hypothetical protein O6H91_10G013400 [Diphasiastrum complanatum]|uniref:Uncharacterized protein n=1 Tax=Diphasiastrum complanatum TaxID=34168 RepID=A0ACC2CEH1_DIPCM|nr:hypothetical protein O6H91_10G013400 [Diphasiastrum complanatum]
MADFVQLTCLPDGVYLLTFKGDGEHRLNPSSMAAIQSALDEVENDKSSRCLITTNEGKFYSNGLDFAFIRRDMMELLFDALHRLLERFLHFPIPTMAAINGHAVAAGCMLALAHDYRFMRSDKGYIFLNEVEIKLPFSPGMNALIRSKLPVHTYHKAVLSGQRYGGKEAERSGFVDAALPDASSTQEEAIRQGEAYAHLLW